RYRFEHALVRDAIEEAMPASNRREHHARVATELADQGDAPSVAVERARHAIEGLGALSEDRAAEFVARAVSVLETEAAHDRALALFRRWVNARSVKPDA